MKNDVETTSKVRRERAPPHCQEEAGAAQVSPADSGGPWLVLLVDDSMILRDRLGATIRGAGIDCQLALAENGAVAREKFQKLKPSLVVLDIALPDVSGLELLKEFKQQRPECVIIMLTTYAFAEFRSRAVSLGADSFLNKAVDTEQLPDILKKHLSRLSDPSRQGEGRG